MVPLLSLLNTGEIPRYKMFHWDQVQSTKRERKQMPPNKERKREKEFREEGGFAPIILHSITRHASLFAGFPEASTATYNSKMETRSGEKSKEGKGAERVNRGENFGKKTSAVVPERYL